MTAPCEDCGSDLHVNSVERPHIDWVKVVCSECGHITDVSVIRLVAERKMGGETR